ncbi:small integral membrane protein 20 isoform X3 [Perognathus longimembris pacificus]|uniref:small integral membrane protein 20 isoform X3 n=1 Tax=Perognathus longimembris pacificus TaxID=214514 RepID=UPI002018CD9B|nr:small integral membrane protein 20 isoform X3 [Perognathus longimembris pacificus]
MSVSRNLRTVLIFGGFVSLVGAAFYPIYFRPLMRVEEYQSRLCRHRMASMMKNYQPQMGGGLG